MLFINHDQFLLLFVKVIFILYWFLKLYWIYHLISIDSFISYYHSYSGLDWGHIYLILWGGYYIFISLTYNISWLWVKLQCGLPFVVLHFLWILEFIWTKYDTINWNTTHHPSEWLIQRPKINPIFEIWLCLHFCSAAESSVCFHF